MKRLLCASILVLAVASPSRAQQLMLQIQDGRVTLDAAGVPAHQILAEWARIGGTKVVGAEKITGPPLTLKLDGMPERQALDIILGNVAGFMAAERQASATPGASVYDRILILATSSAPAATAASARQGGQNPNASAATAGTQRRVPPRPPVQAAEETDESERENTDDADPAAANANPPVFTFPSPAGGNNNPVFVPMNNGNAPVFGSTQPGTVSPPVITFQPNANGQPTIYNFVPNTDGSATPVPAPNTGFGAISPPPPGMIQAVPVPGPGQPRPPR
jgi:hypothetical protein